MTLDSINYGENDGQAGGSLGITFDSQSPSSSFEVGAILKPEKSIEDMNSSLGTTDPDGGILEIKSYSWKTKTNGGDWKEVGNESTYTLTSDDFDSYGIFYEGELNLQLDFTYVDGEGNEERSGNSIIMTAAQPTEYFAPLAAAGMTLGNMGNDDSRAGAPGISFDSQSPSSSFEVGAILKPKLSIEEMNSLSLIHIYEPTRRM